MPEPIFDFRQCKFWMNYQIFRQFSFEHQIIIFLKKIFSVIFCSLSLLAQTFRIYCFFCNTDWFRKFSSYADYSIFHYLFSIFSPSGIDSEFLLYSFSPLCRLCSIVFLSVFFVFTDNSIYLVVAYFLVTRFPPNFFFFF